MVSSVLETMETCCGHSSNGGTRVHLDFQTTFEDMWRSMTVSQ